MDVQVTFKHLAPSESVVAKIHSKTEKLKSLFDGKMHANWVVGLEDHHQFSECELVGPKFIYHAKSQGEDAYKTLDQVMGKIKRQIIRHKEIIKHH